MDFSISIIGHRGSGTTDSSFARECGNDQTRPAENTLTSFRAVLAPPINANGIETDAVRTADDRIVLIHSTLISDHVDPQFVPAGITYIDEMPLAEVQNLRLGRNDEERIPTLWQALNLMRNRGAILNLELKDVQGTKCPRRMPSLSEPVLREIDEAQFPLSRVLFSSFSLDMLADLATHAPEARIGMLFSEKPEPGASLRMFADGPEEYRLFTPDVIKEVCDRIPNIKALHPEIQTLTRETVALAAERELGINTWAWLERSPLVDATFAAAADNAVKLCRQYHVPLTIITDHVVDTRRFIQWLQPTG